MEGDGPTGCMVIPEYVELRHHLQGKIDKLATSDAVYPMLAKMLQKTQEYLDEALGCETLVMATLLHPLFRLKFFHKWFDGKTGAIPMKAEATLRRLHCEYDLAFPRPSSHNKETENPASSSSNPSHKTPRMFHDDSEEEEEEPDSIDNSMDNYLLMSDKMRQRDYNLADPKAALEWWSVSQFFSLMPYFFMTADLFYFRKMNDFIEFWPSWRGTTWPQLDCHVPPKESFRALLTSVRAIVAASSHEPLRPWYQAVCG